VSKVLKFAALYPKHLNLNGDHANLLVLQKRLAWRGVEAQIYAVEEPTKLEEFDLVLLGHGTADAWSEVLSVDPKLISNLVKLVNANHEVLAIGSGFAKLLEGLKHQPIAVIKHRSEFIDADGIVGYINSQYDLPEVTWMNNSLLTLFHGPVFAKNPKLADDFISKAQWCDVSISTEKLEVIENLAKQSRKTAFAD